MANAALGFRSHSGWAALVAVAGTARAPQVILRRRITTWDAQIAGSKQPYHTAESWALPKAEQFIRRCTEASFSLASRELAAAIRDVGMETTMVGAGLLTGSGRSADTLAAALASHSALHTAEGEFYRNAIVHACERGGLEVNRVREKEVFEHAAKALKLPPEALRERLWTMGREIGSPWTQDEKLAALVAWIVLATSGAFASRATARLVKVAAS